MPKIKKCKYCAEVLFCQACGKRQTPDLGGYARKSLSNLVDEDLIQKIEEEAKKKKISVNALLKQKFVSMMEKKCQE